MSLHIKIMTHFQASEKLLKIQTSLFMLIVFLTKMLIIKMSGILRNHNDHKEISWLEGCKLQPFLT